MDGGGLESHLGVTIEQSLKSAFVILVTVSKLLSSSSLTFSNFFGVFSIVPIVRDGGPFNCHQDELFHSRIG